MTSNDSLRFLKKKFHLLEQAIFYLLILLLPTQFGKHFWPSFSYISGIRIDYLSPTIYLTDILIFLLFVIGLVSFTISALRSSCQFSRSAGSAKTSRATLIRFTKFAICYLLFAMVLAVGVLLSKNPQAGFYGILKILEFTFFGFYAAKNIKTLEIKKIAFIFSLGIIFEGALAIFQYLNQGSLGGFFYFLGERMFNSQTPGIANASINGQLILRPYATFPHPNVLAGYLTIAMATVISNFQFPISNFKKRLFLFSLIVGNIALILTMSRIAILVWLFALGIVFYRSFSFRKILTGVFIVAAVFIFSPLGGRFGSIGLKDEALVQRQELISASMAMIKENPIFGVGANNFLNNLSFFRVSKTGSLFNYFQPVHNIYLLIAAETGLVGFGFFAWFIVKTYKGIMDQKSGIKKKKPLIHNFPQSMIPLRGTKFLLLSIVLILGLFDHYFLTLQQGQLLFSFVLGFCFADFNKNKVK